LKSWPESRKRIAVVFKPLISRPVATMTLGDLQLIADSYKSERTGRASPKSAAFAVRTLRPVLKWAAHTGRGYVSEELARISTPGDAKPRKRILSRDELATLLPALRASNRPYAAALHFMLLTITRRQEVATARWQDVDMSARTWIIPETKNGQPHTVPLSRQAMDLLWSRLPGDGQGEPQVADPDALIFATSKGARLLNWDRETKVLQGVSGTKDWTRHDLRRTGATMLGEMGEMPDIIEAALNHAVIHSALAATYNRSRYRPQVAAALQRLADALDGIEAGAANVQPLRLVVG
jgi:integrase